jgi:hypothetical protein
MAIDEAWGIYLGVCLGVSLCRRDSPQEADRNVATCCHFFPPQPLRYTSQSTKQSELRFRALLTQSGTQQLELVRG